MASSAKDGKNDPVSLLGHTFLALVNSNQDFRETISVSDQDLFSDSTRSGNRVRSSHEHANSRYNCRLDYQWINPLREVVACLLCVDSGSSLSIARGDGVGLSASGSPISGLSTSTALTLRAKRVNFRDIFRIGLAGIATGEKTGSSKQPASSFGDLGLLGARADHKTEQSGNALALEMQMRIEDGMGDGSWVRHVWHTASGWVHDAEEEITVFWTPGTKLTFCEGM